MHPSTNRDQGIRDSGYLYWFYVLSCRVSANLYLWKLQISPRKCHLRLISRRVVNTGMWGWSDQHYCTGAGSFLCCHGIDPVIKDGSGPKTWTWRGQKTIWMLQKIKIASSPFVYRRRSHCYKFELFGPTRFLSEVKPKLLYAYTLLNVYKKLYISINNRVIFS